MVLEKSKYLNKYLKKADLTLLAFALGYFTTLFVPAYFKLIHEGSLFGSDVGEYILTAECWAKGKSNIFAYPYPITPLIYMIPSLIIKDPLLLYTFGDFVSIFITIAMTISMYYLLKTYRGSSVASFIGTMTFGTFPLLLDIIGWGGQSTLLATFFGILALVFAQKYIRSTSAKNLGLTSFLLLISSATEPYIAIYFLIAIGIIFLVKEGFKSNLSSIAKKIILFSPTLIAIFLLLFALNIPRENFPIPMVIYMLNDPSIISSLVSRLTFDDLITLLAIISVLPTWMLLCMFKFKKVMNICERDRIVLISSSMAFLTLFLLTPSQYADRALFLFSIPLAIAISDITYYVTIHTINRNVIAVLALLCFMFVLLLLGKGLSIYVSSLSFYYIDKNLLIHVLPLRQVDGNILYISPFPWTFALAYVSGKEVYPTQQPVWFIRESQINAVTLAFESMWGVRWIDAGEIKVIDASPLWAQPAPAICVAKYPYYVELFRLSDGVLPIAFSPSNNESIIWHESPFYVPKKGFWNINTTMFSMYESDTLAIVKSITVDEDGIVDIALKYNFTNSFPRRIDIRLISLMLKDIRAYILFSNDTQAKVRLIQSFKEPWYKQYYDTLVELQVKTPDIRQTVNFVERDEWGLPEIEFVLTPTTHTNVISILIRIKINDVKVETPHLVLRDDALRSNNIKFAIIDKRVHPDVLQLFERDPNFEKYEELLHYVIYRLKGSSNMLSHAH
jgi:hypothetical protein